MSNPKPSSKAALAARLLASKKASAAKPGLESEEPPVAKGNKAAVAKDLSKQAVGGAVKGAAAGAAKGAAGGAPGAAAGAAVGAAKSLGVAVLTNRTSRKWILIAVAAVVGLLVVVPVLIFSVTVFSLTAIGTSNQNGTYQSIQASGVDQASTNTMVSQAEGTHVPWPLAMSVDQTQTPVDFAKLSAALVKNGLGQVNQELGAGSVYDGGRGIRRPGTSTSQKDLSSTERTGYVAALTDYGLTPAQASAVYTQALQWTLGQVNDCGTNTSRDPIPTSSPSSTPTPSATAAAPGSQEPIVYWCGDSIEVTGPAVNPLGPAYYIISDVFGLRPSPCAGCSTLHSGYDLAAACNTNIYAAMDGTVTISAYGASAGQHIEIKHPNGVTTQYMHMPDSLPNGRAGRVAQVGDETKEGQLIGHVGSTGDSTGCHLHFGTKINGVRVDPSVVMMQLGVDLVAEQRGKK